MLRRLKWFEDARYGLFIHWGLYAELGGIWNQTAYPGGTEWIMRTAKIPFDSYRKLADTFNPVLFDAEEWASMAESFGVRYVCITSKHHDGFAMFDSKASDYTIMHTPFGRDVIKELSDACRRHGLTFCVYYSQMQDWADPDADGNTWDYDPKEKHFETYFRQKVLPQVKELLTNYGEIGMIWFDTPYDMPKSLCEELERFVHALQPQCLINGRIGYGIGDYRQMSDNEIPVLAYHGAWETPMTLNHTWGYSVKDEDWKTPKRVIKMLTDVVSKGGNLLLNVGPDAMGRIPQGSRDVLSRVGAWLRENGESIYKTTPCPDLPYQIPWGSVTARGSTMYLHVLTPSEAPGRIKICNIETKAKKVTLLKTGENLPFTQSYEPARDEYRFIVEYPLDKLDPLDTVIKAEFEESPVIHSLYMTFDGEEKTADGSLSDGDTA